MDADTLIIKIPLNDDDYKREFDSSVLEWRHDRQQNYFFLKVQQNYVNDLLRAQGFVFLNDVLKTLGFQQTAIGAVTGWVFDKDAMIFIDFGMNWDGIDDLSSTISLSFNVEGVIVDKI